MRFLIIKTGEVFRSGVLLSRLLPDNEVYWYGVPGKLQALFPPIENLHFIDTLEEAQKPDVIFYLERTQIPFPEEWASKIKGFYFDGNRWRTKPRFPELENLIDSNDNSRHSHPHWLYKLCGMQWRGEPYWSYIRIQGGNLRKRPLVGLNPRVGLKWPQKAWPMECWWSLAKKLQSAGCEVAWQPGGTMVGYADWIYNLDLLISVDTLGLHIALLNTSPSEMPPVAESLRSSVSPVLIIKNRILPPP